jgi:formylglycine-generating enzyme required for sulfatase activity
MEKPESYVPGKNMVYIKGGTFIMGKPGGFSGDKPHKVTVGSFFMDKYLVTQKEFLEVMGENNSCFRRKNNPVDTASWYEAIEYCNERSIKEGLSPVYTIDKTVLPLIKGKYLNWLVTWDRNAGGYRLPTEAEWEYACRAGTTTAFNTGKSIDSSQARFNDTIEDYPEIRSTSKVGFYKPNGWVLYYMNGNLKECCWEWSASYSIEAQTDIGGPEHGTCRVLRGGAWDLSCFHLESGSRDEEAPYFAIKCHTGFRVVRSCC